MEEKKLKKTKVLHGQFTIKLQRNMVMWLTLTGKQRKGNRKQLSKANDLFISHFSLSYYSTSMEIFARLRNVIMRHSELLFPFDFLFSKRHDKPV